MKMRVTRLIPRSAAIASLCLLVGASGGQGQPVQSDPFRASGGAGVALTLDRVTVSVAVSSILRASTTSGYVLCDAVLTDKRLVSLRFQPYQLSLSNVSLWLGAQGYALRLREGVIYVCNANDRSSGAQAGGTSGGPAGSSYAGAGSVSPGPVASVGGGAPAGGVYAYNGGVAAGPGVPLGSPLAPSALTGAPATAAVGAVPGGVFEVAAYRPDYVDPSTIAEVVRAMLPEASVAVSVAKVDARPAVFVRGAPDVVERFRVLAHYVDAPSERVEVSAILAEVSTSGRSGWSVNAIASALSSRLGLSIGQVASGFTTNGDQLSFKSKDFSAVLGVISTTANTRVLSTPRVSGRSGEALRLQVGSDVPVLGSIYSPGGLGTTAQEVTYRSSGVIFEVTPTVRGRVVTVAFKQELSAFAETETGVRGSPTLSKRELTSAVDMDDGEWVILGGLRSSEVQGARASLLGIIPTGKSKVTRETELVLILNVRVIRREARPPKPLEALPASPDVDGHN